MDFSRSKRVRVNGVQHHDTVLNRLWGMVQSRDKVDFCLAGSGRLLQAHQLILGLFFEPQQLLDIEPQHWQGSSLELLLEFTYLGTVSVPEEQMDTLLELARQLNFNMLVNALLSAKSSIDIINRHIPNPGPRIADLRSGDTGLFRSANALQKLKPGSNGLSIVNNVQPLTIERSLVGCQYGAGVSLTPDVVGETEWQAQPALNSVTTETVVYSEIKLENFDSDESVGSYEADRSELIVTRFSNSQFHDHVDGFQCCSYDDEAQNLNSPGDELNAILNEEVNSAPSEELEVQLASNDQLLDHEDYSTNQQEIANDLVSTGVRVANDNLRSGSREFGKNDQEFKINSNETANSENVYRRGATSKAIERFECPDCRKVYKNERVFTIHCLSVHAARPFKCRLCVRAFRSKADLRDHHRIHTKYFNCRVCKKEFRTNGDLKDHTRIHSIGKPFKDQAYKKAFSTNRDLKVRLSVQSRDKPLECKVCEKKFTYRGSLKKHSEIHTGVPSISYR